MKRNALIKHLLQHNCELAREGRSQVGYALRTLSILYRSHALRGNDDNYTAVCPPHLAWVGILALSNLPNKHFLGMAMYQELFDVFKNVKNLGGKAWEHAVAIDVLSNTTIEDCSIHCFHYQQMFECLFKHILETKTQFHAYSRSHHLNNLLEEVIGSTSFRTDKSKYRGDLTGITVCAEEYRYNFDINCKAYHEMVNVCDELLKELIAFAQINIGVAPST
ncbi:hypothetical protein TI03_00700 [Achromatium sp. WMS1]|nr:hypothetical protein TI03_00700 [Achromatium sp. WMS1]